MPGRGQVERTPYFMILTSLHMYYTRIDTEHAIFHDIKSLHMYYTRIDTEYACHGNTTYPLTCTRGNSI